MKIIKKVFIGLAIFFALLFAAAFVLPRIFKDDIKTAIDREIAKSVNADVIFDVNNFSLSLFSNFPNMTVEVKELGVFNRAPFEGHPLFVIEEFQVEINLRDILFGDQLRVKGITLSRPQISIKVLKDGSANYDIVIPSTDTVKQQPSEPSKFSFGIDHWEVINGSFVYDDQTMPYFMSIKDLDHSGNGNFNEAEFDLKTTTIGDSLTVSYGGVEYLSDKRAEIDMTIGISEAYTRYTFKENMVKLNDFTVNFDGWFKMNEQDFGMDIRFKSPETSFKSLLSLVPGLYSKDFSKIETKGELEFNGFVKGIYNKTQMPAFTLGMRVNDAMFKYPDLPSAVTNINMDLLVDNKTGVIENTVIDLKKLHMNFGSNPLDARIVVENLKDFRMDANVKAKLNLAELTKMVPTQGMELKGSFEVDAKAKGVYDSVRKIIPAIDVLMRLDGGYAKASQFPLPLEDIRFTSTVKNSSGKMAETFITVKDFAMVMEGEKFAAELLLQNLDDYTWDLKVNGGIDIEKMTKIFPVEGMSLAGKVKANIQTKGKFSDVDAKRYDKLPTSGSASLKDFKFSTKTLAYAVAISQAEATFNPQKIELKNTSGTIGKSDFSVDGSVSNYIGYVFGKETIKGNVNFNSTLLDLNEFMTESTEPAKKDTASFGVIPIPQNIDFTMHSDVKTVKMMEYILTNASGDVVLREGVANLSGVKFNMLGGSFGVNGAYNTKDINHPKYDFALKIENLSIQQAANSFSVVKTYAPIAGLVNGNFGTDFKINGELGQDMMPKLNTVAGAGLIKIAQASLTKSNLVSSITSLTKLNNTDNVSLQDVLMSATIADGRLSVKPFNVKFGDYVTTISGSSGLDKSIDYTLKMMVPARQLGSQFQGFLNQATGSQNATSEIPVTIGLTGLFSAPKTTLLMQEQKQQVKEAVTNVAVDKGKEVLKDVIKDTPAKDLINGILGGGTKKDSTKTDTTKADPLKEALQNKLNKFFKKKNN
ncbi:MAG: AsmA family protein [Cyclobacteriaceae bacterium]|nr:AsmA family protein [Cyclobacteriaceae bacterium]